MVKIIREFFVGEPQLYGKKIDMVGNPYYSEVKCLPETIRQKK